jgi:RNA polymerase sigma-70 factor (ECF subfamily)
MHALLLTQSGPEIGEPGPETGQTGSLAAEVARGDPGALERLIALHQPRVARLAYRLLGWRGDVDDVVQDVFLAALRSGQGFRGHASLWTWLSTITINRCRSHHRRRAVASRVLRFAGKPGLEDAADRSTLADETAREVRAAVSRLRAKHREVVVLYYLESRTVAEMSEMLGVAPNAIEVRLHRARRCLRESLGAFMKD